MASASLGPGGVGSSRAMNSFKASTSSVDWLGREMLEMRLRDNRLDQDDDKDSEPDIVDGMGAEAGHIIATTIGGRNGQPKLKVSYIAEHVVGTGSFGVVFQAKCKETGEIVAIKKVLQDKRYKNRELQIMQMLDHPNIVALKHCFFSTTDKEELYLNLVLEFVPETVNRIARQFNRMSQRMPLIYVKLYTYQICRALAYIHNCIGICHRDIKPQNLLVNPHTHQLKLCDFGSAKVLVKGEPNISYVCARYYRAPELIFGATEYTTAIDMWSTGCVMAELLLGKSSVETLKEEKLKLEQELLATRKDCNQTLEKLQEAESKCLQLQQNLQSFQEKLSNCEDENHVLRQKALCGSPTGSLSGFFRPFSEKYSGALIVPNMDRKHLLDSPTASKILLSPHSLSPRSLSPRSISEPRRSHVTAESHQDNHEFLLRCIKEDLGFKDGKPMAACIIFKCLIHWRAFEAERTTIFDCIIAGINGVLKVNDSMEH